MAEAMGYEFLGENAQHIGEWRQGLESAAIEREIALHLHSRERLAWTGLYAGFCAWQFGDFERAEKELTAEIALAEAVGELLAGSMFEVVSLSERILKLAENTDARISRIWVGPLHIEALLKLGRVEEVRERLAVYREMVDERQTPHFDKETERLAVLLA